MLACTCLSVCGYLRRPRRRGNADGERAAERLAMFVTECVTKCYNCNTFSRETFEACARPRMSRTQCAQARTTTGLTVPDLRLKLGAKKEKSGGRRVAGLFRSLVMPLHRQHATAPHTQTRHRLPPYGDGTSPTTTVGATLRSGWAGKTSSGRPPGLGIYRMYPYHVPRAAGPVAGGSRGRRDGLADPTCVQHRVGKVKG